MATPRFNFNTQRVEDPTKGATAALGNIAAVMKAANDSTLKQREADNSDMLLASNIAYTDSKNSREQQLFDLKMKEAADNADRQVKKDTANDAVLQLYAKFNPNNIGSSKGLEKVSDRISAFYNKGVNKAEQRIAELGLNADNGDGDAIAKIYRESIWGDGTTEAEASTKRQQLQKIYDSNTLGKNEASAYIREMLASAGAGPNVINTTIRDLAAGLHDYDKEDSLTADRVNKQNDKLAKLALDVAKVNMTAANKRGNILAKKKRSGVSNSIKTSDYQKIFKTLNDDRYRLSEDATSTLKNQLLKMQAAGVPSYEVSSLLEGVIKPGKEGVLFDDAGGYQTKTFSSYAKHLINKYGSNRGRSSNVHVPVVRTLNPANFMPKHVTSTDIADARNTGTEARGNMLLDMILRRKNK